MAAIRAGNRDAFLMLPYASVESIGGPQAVADVAVVGSGPSGCLAAERLLDAGLRVTLVDVGHDDAFTRGLVPDQPFREIRYGDPDQRRY